MPHTTQVWEHMVGALLMAAFWQQIAFFGWVTDTYTHAHPHTRQAHTHTLPKTARCTTLDPKIKINVLKIKCVETKNSNF